MNTTLIAALLAATTLAPIAAMGAPKGSPMAVTQAWSRPAARGLSTGVVYLRIDNRGGGPDRLIGASTPAAARMELHRSSLRNGVMSMEAIPNGVEIPARGFLQLSPDGYHFMLTGLKTALSAGSRFAASLQFAHAGSVSVHVQVRTAAPEATMAGMRMP